MPPDFAEDMWQAAAAEIVRSGRDYDAVVVAKPYAVRDALAAVVRHLRAHGVEAEDCARFELVLAEALNNVVEHAYAASADGIVHVSLDFDAGAIRVCIRDSGEPMPGARLPAGRPASDPRTLPDLPEGGFGWTMIHALADKLAYQRSLLGNSLSFRVVIGSKR